MVYTNNKENNMAKKLNKLSKVNESFTINRYDNGFMIEDLITALAASFACHPEQV